MKASILTIGDEILNGSTLDTNSTFIAKNAIKEGIEIVSILSVADTKKGITDGLNFLKYNSKLIFITGGLGPTKDDITVKTLADFLEEPLVFNNEIFDRINSMLSARKDKNVSISKESCMFPKGAKFLTNKKGTAPCMWLQKEDVIFVSMPGVPLEMKQIFIDEVLPKVVKQFKITGLINKYILTAGIWESEIAKRIKDIENVLPDNISIAYLPKLGQVTLRISGKNTTESIIQKIVDDIILILGNNVFSLVENDSLEKVVGKILKEKNKTLATAESCTGGKIAHKITSIAGSSSYFEGTIVSYSNNIKMNVLGVKKITLENYGAVSEQTVIEMAKGALGILKTDYSIAVTGIAGPTGGTKEKPVGTVWIAVSDSNKTIAKKFNFWPFRAENIELSSVAALNMLKNFIS